MRISDWSSDVCSSDLHPFAEQHLRADAVDHVIAQVLGLQPVEAPLALERAACLRLAADAGDGAGEILAPGPALGAPPRVYAVDRDLHGTALWWDRVCQ